MAVTNPIATFLWGAGGAALSPEQVAREREIAAALMQGGVDYSPVDHWLQGAARAAQAGVGALKGRWADEAETRGREGFQSQWDSVFGGGASPVAPALAGGSPASGGSFLDALVNSESGGNWQALNSEGYGGRLQFGQDRLADAAAAGVIPAGMTGADFAMMPPEVQQAVEQWHFNDIEKQAENMGLTQYYGQTIAGVPITPDSVKAMAHLGGIGGAAKFITSGGQYNPADSNGTRLSDYGRRFGGASSAPAQVAQGPDMAALLGLSGNQWASPQQQAVMQALMGQQIQQQDPRYQQQLAMGDLQMQQAQMELEAMRNPAAPAPVWQGGQWWDISSGVPTPLTEAAPDGDTAKEQQISRMMETGIDRQTAINIIDGRWRYDANPVTGAPMVTDVATGLPVHQPATPGPAQVSQGDPDVMKQFGQQYPAAQEAFGLPGAAASAINTIGGAVGMTPYPEIQQTQADFAVLRESLLNDIASSYSRQPPSWLLQEIRNLTPSAGSPMESADSAVSKLNAMGRHLRNELALTNQALQRELSPDNRQEMEARRQGLEAGIARVTGAISSFESRGSAPQDAPPEPQDSPPEPQDIPPAPEGIPLEEWQALTPEERALWQ